LNRNFDPSHLEGACCGLVIIDKKREIIQLVHSTLHEYFQDTLNRWFPTTNFDIANTCVLYLSLKDFSGGPVKSYEEAHERLKKPLFSYAVDYWGHHASASSFCTPQLLNLLTKSEWVSMVVQYCDIFSEVRKKSWLSSEDLKPTQNAFHMVGVYGLDNLVKALFARAQDIDPDLQDKEGRTPLSWAAEYGHTEVVKTLLSDGRVDPDRQDNNGQTPLSWAARKGHTEVVKCLLGDGRVDPDRQDNHGTTPLDCASSHGHMEIIKALLCDSQVDPNGQDNDGQTPLSWAVENGQTEVVKGLSSHN
jgi:FOG: Ankyrin repeat